MASNKDKQNVELTRDAHKALAMIKVTEDEVKTMADAVLHLVSENARLTVELMKLSK